MLNSVNLNDKTYEELLAEAIAQIPLYSSEWTNYNISDPGITILQNLTSFQMLHQGEINKVPEQTRRKLLKLLGYTAQENRASQILVQVPREGGNALAEGDQLWSGTIPFETMQGEVFSPWSLAAVYTLSQDGLRDVTRLLDMTTDACAFPFGVEPEYGNAITCILDGTPPANTPLYLWVQVAQEELRNPFDDQLGIPVFSRVKWQYFTADGWREMRAEDETLGLLRSGAVKLWMEGADPVPFTRTPVQGCAVRCMLEEADYDRTPRLRGLAVNLFPMKQQNTCVKCCVCQGADRVELVGRLPMTGNLAVFCKERPNGNYVLYRETLTGEVRGRAFRREETSSGVNLYFDPGPDTGPCSHEDAVRVICYDNEMVHHRALGPVYGYDDQIIQLKQVENVLPESLLLGMEVREGEFCFIAPGEQGPDGFLYELESQSGKIVIREPGRGGYQLIVASCAVTQGDRGNLRSCAVLEQRGGYDGNEVEQRFLCPSPGWGGQSYESAEQLRQRFSAGMRQIAVAVRAEDYEGLVYQTPGLCIHKVRAVANSSKNLVKIAVKPYTEEKLPRLSDSYLEQIRTFLEEHRMLTTRIELCQPRYVPIGVTATVNVRGMASRAREEIEQLLRSTLDHVNGPQGFGGWLRFHELYQKLSDLPFVEGVDALNMYPESRDAMLQGSDICLDEDSLCYAGSIRLTIREHGR